MKKIVLTIMTSLAFTAGIFAQEANIAFENKISSDVVSISEGEVEFAGIKEQITAEIETEKVDAGVSFITYLGNDDNNNFGFTGYEFDKAYVEFRPIDFLSLDFNKKIFTAGSYLPIADDNLGNGNIASDFSVVLRPVENLSVAAGIKLPSVFADSNDKIDLDAGLDYTNDFFSVGATVRSPINNLGFGVFGSFTGVENLAVNLGFAYNDDFCDIAGTLLSLGTTYEISIFAIAFDCVTNFGNDGNDLYTALCIETSVTDSVIIETQATFTMDFADTKATETIAELGAAYVIGNHKLRAGIAAEFTDSVGFAIPVYYKYSF